MRKHSRLPGNQCLIVTHNFWALILTTCVQYGNRSQKLHPRSPRIQHNMDSCVRGTIILQKRMPKIDNYVVAVCRATSRAMVDGIIVSHIPKKISCLCAVFIKRGSTIQCIVSAIYHCIFPTLTFCSGVAKL